jgi:hypothetical protein
VLRHTYIAYLVFFCALSLLYPSNSSIAGINHVWRDTCNSPNRLNVVLSSVHEAVYFLRLIHTYHAVPMPRPCRSPAMPCRLGFGLCLSHLIYTVRPCLIHTSHSAPVPCHDHAFLKATSQGHGTARHGRGMVKACVKYHRPSRDGMWATCPRSASSGYHAEFNEGCYQKHTNPLNCRTSSPDISGCHTDFHEGHGTVGEWQGRGMACVN